MKKQAMKSYLERHNRTFNATDLARSLGWMRTKRWKDSDGTQHERTYPNTKTVVRIAKKVAQVESGPKNERYYKITAR
jgi:hypothetical protein